VILALDVNGAKRAVEVASKTAEYIDAIKVGYPLILSAGLGIISDMKRFSLPIIADFKVADVPHVSAEICRLATKAGADFVIVQGVMGGDVVEACSKVARLFVVSDMSHPGALNYISGHNKEIAGLAKRFAEGIVAPATRPQTIKTLRSIVGDLIIISPGVKAQGAKVGSAIYAGADFEIIGRAIYSSPDPALAAEQIKNQIERVDLR
jgi:orotidine-5'-phosphate decarboxylase